MTANITTSTGAYVGRDLHVGRDLKITVKNSPPPKKISYVSTLPPSRSPPPLFTGRLDFLKKLHDSIKKCGSLQTGDGGLSKRMTVIVGLGGIGKSSTAMTYATVYKNEHRNNVAWIDADTDTSLMNSFKGLARHFRICADILNKTSQQEDDQSDEDRAADVANLVSQVYRHFSDHVRQGLFIFDNAHQMRSSAGVGVRGGGDCGILDFLTKEQLDNYPLLLVTSRNKNWGVAGNEIQTLELTDLSPEESFGFFHKSFKIEKDPPENLQKSLSKLITLLGGFPLALCLAASNISEAMACRSKNELVEEVDIYLEIFEKNAAEWVTMGFSQDSLEPYNKIMATVWRGTVDKIRGQQTIVSQISLELLKIISYLPPSSISFKFVRCLHQNISPGHMESAQKTEATRNLRRALDLLQKYSMVQHVGPLSFGEEWEFKPYSSLSLFQRDKSGIIRIHRLVQLWTRQDQKDRHEFGTLLAIAEYYKNWRPECTELRDCFDPILDFLKNCGWPQRSYRYAIFDVITRHELESEKDEKRRPIPLLMVPFKFLEAQPPHERDLECYDCVKMGLVYFKHRSKFWRGLPFQKDSAEQKEFDLTQVLDNSEIFQKSDTFCKILMAKFLDWVCATLISYESYQLLNELGRHVLFPLHVYKDPVRWRELDETFRFKFPAWIISFAAAMKHGGKEAWVWHVTYAHRFFVMAERAEFPSREILRMILQVNSSCAYCKFADDRPKAWTSFATSIVPLLKRDTLDSIVGPDDQAMKTELFTVLNRGIRFVIYTVTNELKTQKYYVPDICEPLLRITKVLSQMTEQFAEFILTDFEFTQFCAKLFRPYSQAHPHKFWMGKVAFSSKDWRNLAALCLAICKCLSSQSTLDSSSPFFSLLEEIKSVSGPLISAIKSRKKECPTVISLYLSITFQVLSVQILGNLIQTHDRRVLGLFFDLVDLLLSFLIAVPKVSHDDMHLHMALKGKFNSSEHFGVECDSCESYPIAEIRFKCKVCPSFDLCQPCYHNQDKDFHEHTEFWKIICTDPEVPYQKLNWVTNTTKGQVPDGSLVGGHERGEPLFVGRATVDSDLILGKVSSSSGGCTVFGPGSKMPVVMETFETLVLPPNEVSWVFMAKDDKFPVNAIPAGRTSFAHNILYIGRAQCESHLIVGKVVSTGSAGNGWCLQIHFDGKLVTHHEGYEVLVWNSGKSATQVQEDHEARLISKGFSKSDAKFALQVFSGHLGQTYHFLQNNWQRKLSQHLCDGCECKLAPTLARFKCQKCADFDFCWRCRQTVAHQHDEFWKIIDWGHAEGQQDNELPDPEPIEWVAGVQEGEFPQNAVIGGVDEKGGSVVVGRAKLLNGILPGGVTQSHKGCMVSLGGHGAVMELYEVMVIPSDEVTWTASANGELLPHGVVGGMSSRGELLFIGRVELPVTLDPDCIGLEKKMKTVVGKIQPSLKRLFVTSDLGKEIAFKEYEQLTYKTV